jgi:uncharacterized membrane protein YqaE (UPF0057 family)
MNIAKMLNIYGSFRFLVLFTPKSGALGVDAVGMANKKPRRNGRGWYLSEPQAKARASHCYVLSSKWIKMPLPFCWEYIDARLAPKSLLNGRLFTMRLIIAIFLPWLLFLTIGRPFSGIICLILQITLIGWIPAALWAVFALSQFKTDQKINAAQRISP